MIIRAIKDILMTMFQWYLFIPALKKEDKRMNKYIDFNDAKISTFQYIESWYNRKRIHSRIGFMTPQAYENLIIKST
ncbi:IS3 family transposase [Clostridium neonatale]|nr:IS3 family transposase [Clostridium neonatale]CAI3651943.1 putative transposase [Clostridium neonatale]